MRGITISSMQRSAKILTLPLTINSISPPLFPIHLPVGVKDQLSLIGQQANKTVNSSAATETEMNPIRPQTMYRLALSRKIRL
jgi:hypothetical protein